MAPLQGFLNCLVYGWIRGSFQRALNLGTDSNLLSWSTRRISRNAVDNSRYTDYGTLSNTEDEYEGLTSENDVYRKRKKEPFSNNTQNNIVLSTSESAVE